MPGVDDVSTKTERTYGVLERLARTKLAVFVVVAVTGLMYMDHYKRIDQDVVVYLFYGICAVAIAYLVMQGLIDHAKARSDNTPPPPG